MGSGWGKTSVIKLRLLVQEDFGTLMTSKFADKSGSINPSVTGCGGNYRIPGVLSGSRRNRSRPVACAHQIERCGHEVEHPAHSCLSAVRRFSEIKEGLKIRYICLWRISGKIFRLMLKSDYAPNIVLTDIGKIGLQNCFLTGVGQGCRIISDKL
jgi:hypothetical protein